MKMRWIIRLSDNLFLIVHPVFYIRRIIRDHDETDDSSGRSIHRAVMLSLFIILVESSFV